MREQERRDYYWLRLRLHISVVGNRRIIIDVSAIQQVRLVQQVRFWGCTTTFREVEEVRRALTTLVGAGATFQEVERFGVR